MKMKKLLAILALSVLTVFTLAVSASAVTTVHSGKCGDNLTWVLTTDGKLTISGSGYMDNYTFDKDTGVTTAPWGEYHKQLRSLEIGYYVKGIGEFAFFGCDTLTGTLDIPYTVGSIGNYAFMDCGFTGDLRIPNQVTRVGEGAFSGCRGFDGELTLGTAVTTIGNLAFEHCENLTGNLVIPDSVTSIGTQAFNQCKSLSGQLVIPAGMSRIGNRAFAGCDGIDEILFLGRAPSIGEYSFSDIQATASYPKNHKTWTNPARQNYGGSLTWSSYTEKLVAAGKCGKTLIWTLTEDGKMTVHGQGDMYNYSKKLDEGTTQTTLAQWLSVKDVAPTSLVIEEGVTSIGSGAFYDCGTLTGNLVIPEGVTEIGIYAFYNCSGLTGNLVIPGSVTDIGESAFNGCTGFTGDLVIPDSVEVIGDYAFSGCTGFTGKLVIGNGVTEIGRLAFNGCNGFKGELVIGSSVKTIEDWAFDSCSGFTGDLIIPDSVEMIGTNAFRYCTGFDGNLVIGGASDDRGVTVGNSRLSDGAETVRLKSYDSTDVFIGDGMDETRVTRIGESAFYGCSGFKGELVIGCSAKTVIRRHAFADCKGITRVRFTGDAPIINGGFMEWVSNVTVVYPADNATWKRFFIDNYYGAHLTWIPDTLDTCFTQQNTYDTERFADVSSDAWYANGVRFVYERGLMIGTGADTFHPTGTLTVAELVKIACSLHDAYYGETPDYTADGTWYQPYVDRALALGIIGESDYPSYTETATRADFVTILSMALPKDVFRTKNRVGYDAIPDVNGDEAYADAVLDFYRAGIIIGVDQEGTFRPTGSITRAEVAQIIIRVADSTARVGMKNVSGNHWIDENGSIHI